MDDMREIISLIESLNEGDVVNFRRLRSSPKTQEEPFSLMKSLQQMSDELSSSMKGSKFLPMARSYIDSGFSEDKKPTLKARIDTRYHRPSPEIRSMMSKLKKRGWGIQNPWMTLPKKSDPRRKAWDLAEDDFYGPTVLNNDLSFEDARDMFVNRNAPEFINEFGKYVRSSKGYDDTPVFDRSEEGTAWTLMVCGYDDVHQKYWTHIIDDDADWKEFEEAMVMIRRAKMTLGKF